MPVCADEFLAVEVVELIFSIASSIERVAIDAPIPFFARSVAVPIAPACDIARTTKLSNVELTETRR